MASLYLIHEDTSGESVVMRRVKAHRNAAIYLELPKATDRTMIRAAQLSGVPVSVYLERMVRRMLNT